MGDLNINLFKIEEHRQTSNYLDIMYSHSLFPLITKPTRVTGNSATLIDHIFTNNFGTNVTHTQGILCTTICYHYAVFHIAGNMHGGRNSSAGENDTPVMKRNICQRNIITQPFIQAADQRKHQRPASLTFVSGIHRCSPHKGPVTRKMFPFDDIMMDVYLSHGCQAATPHTDFL